MKYEDVPRDGAGEVIAAEVEFPVEVDLLRPVEVGGRKLESLSLQREPTALDLELCFRRDGDMTRMIHLVANLAELAPDEVRSLKAVDFTRLAQVAGAFL